MIGLIIYYSWPNNFDKIMVSGGKSQVMKKDNKSFLNPISVGLMVLIWRISFQKTYKIITDHNLSK